MPVNIKLKAANNGIVFPGPECSKTIARILIIPIIET